MGSAGSARSKDHAVQAEALATKAGGYIRVSTARWSDGLFRLSVEESRLHKVYKSLAGSAASAASLRIATSCALTPDGRRVAGSAGA